MRHAIPADVVRLTGHFRNTESTGPTLSRVGTILNKMCETDMEMQELTQEDLDKKPWKYIGYKEFVKFVSSSDDFFALRRFDKLHCRVLLRLQDQLAELEEELDALDNLWSEREQDPIDNGTFRGDQPKRKEILDKIYAVMCRYDSLLCRYLQLKSAPRAPELNIHNMKTWLSNMNSPIESKEVQFLHHKDLFSMTAGRKSSVRQVFEQRVLLPLARVFANRQKGEQSQPVYRTVTQVNDEPVDSLMTVGIFATAVIMLITPLWILATIGETTQKLKVITVFLVVFLAVLNWGTLARPFEILVATAGYSAVLVVFLQLGTSPQG